MKVFTIISFVLFIQTSLFSQLLSFSKYSLLIETEGNYEEIKDELIIKNLDEKSLIIDSIYSSKRYFYPAEIITDTSKIDYVISFSWYNDPIIIAPEDSVKMIFYMPDLCPLCDKPTLEFFTDSLYFLNNSINNPVAVIPASGDGWTDVTENKSLIKDFKLHQNYPNPFNPATTIEFDLPYSTEVKLKVYNLLGEEVKTLIDEYKDTGNHQVAFNAENLSSGVYIYRLTAGNRIFSGKMNLLK